MRKLYHSIRQAAFLLCLVLLASCQQNADPNEGFLITEKSESKPELRMKEEFDMLKNPVTGKIPDGIRQAELTEAATVPLREELGLNAGNPYVFQGPNNLGGRCRAVAFDVRYDGNANRVMLAGGVSGGMFRSTNGGQDWTRVSSLDNIHNVTCVAQDPRPGHQDTWYFGTGESIGNSAGATGGTYWGFGIFKSTDNGITWNPLASTTSGSQFTFDNRFDFVSKIVVDPTNGHVYAGTLNTISRSTNGGTNWTTDLGTFGGFSGGATDIVVTPTGVLYAAIHGRSGASEENQGVWKKTSSGGSWTRIAQGGSPAWFKSGNSLGRVSLAIAPSSPNLLYVLYYNGKTSACDAPTTEADFGRYDDDTQTWTDLSANLPDESGCSVGNDPFAVQGGYDIIVAVKPNDPTAVFIGGTNAYRSIDGFNTPNNYSRIGGYANTSGYSLYANHHPDIHAFAFAPNNPNLMVCGSDGGVHLADISAGNVTWTSLNNNFTTFQYYYVAMDPTAGSDKYIGGTQDNGTNYRNIGTNAHLPIFGGDGVSVGVSANNTHQYLGFQSGPVFRRSSGQAAGFVQATLTPPNLSASRLFVTLFHLDPDNSTIFYYADFNKLYRNGRIDTVLNNTPAANRMEQITGVEQSLGAVNIRSFATSRGNYNDGTSKLYFGTNDGRIYRIDDPRNCPLETNPVIINSGSGMPSGTIMGLAVNPRNADTLMAVFSNYGIVNIWFCGNATSPNPTWTAIEGNLTLPSVRSACIVADQNGFIDYYVGTSTGLYSTTLLNGNSTVWTKEGAGTIGNAVVVDLKLRTSDNRMLVGTHGNGMFATDVVLPVKFSSFKGQIVHGKTLLHWETQTELNNRGFDIEKSFDGQSYSRIGFVPGKGNSTQRLAYEYKDAAKLQRMQYYRLKQIDKDGRSTYSQVVKINLDGMPLELTKVINPMSTNLIFTLNDVPDKTLQLSLVDGAGRIVLRQKLPSGNSNVFRVNVTSIPNGIYTLLLQSDGFNETRRVIKQM